MRNGLNILPSGAVQGLPSVFVSTGCTSSDIFVAPVLTELQRRGGVGHVAGLGGAPLREQGVELLLDTTPTSTVGWYAGFSAALHQTGAALRAYKDVAAYFRRFRPALAILVDNPGLNLRLLS